MFHEIEDSAGYVHYINLRHIIHIIKRPRGEKEDGYVVHLELSSGKGIDLGLMSDESFENLYVLIKTA